MRKAISFTDSSSPSLLRWIRSTVRIQALRLASYLIGSKGRISPLDCERGCSRDKRLNSREPEIDSDCQWNHTWLPVDGHRLKAPLLNRVDGAVVQTRIQRG